MAPAVSHTQIVCSSKASNAITVNSPADARAQLELFLCSDPETNLLLKLSWANLNSQPVRQILRAVRRKYRVEYDPDYEVLKVKAMPSPLHNALSECMALSLAKANVTVLTPDEIMRILILAKNRHLSRSPTLSPGKKPVAWIKEPDFTICFKELGHKAVIRVVFEIGFTESYSDLLRDASQWLLRSGGEVKLAIIIKIDEDKRQLHCRQRTEEFTSGLSDLISKYGDAESRHCHNIEAKGPVLESSYHLYEAIQSEITASDWVGQISAYLEMWEMNGGRPALRGSRIDILPTPSNPRDPEIRITDLIPEDRRTLFTDPDESKTIKLDMSFYREALNLAMPDTAFTRAVKVIRPLDKGREGA
ncbi:uncharacterized protein P174DRAFT_416361 [Aspergillus novofumigatus IBT 16806]|uniref:Uncharacterized protein n=1 Tax=Aspergillus novofumigatus (strain IBT 16806) TaxID=1392255 RepID=A0A2I1CM00_ASPN1|nr:uncharacterized protein P174DRAFT_416361 [Aspergillus novofumigatus IBT 16806]PKX98636.1 hypothetical protein P174DRAFT_416361 [Aspergillus novofumigatus IBT 16806]